MAQYDVSEIAIGNDSYVLKDAQAREVKANQSDIAIIIEGNKTTHTGGVAIGDFVIVRNSTISGITDGLYKAVQAIPANTAITSAYLEAVSGGIGSEVASLKNNLDSLIKVKKAIVTVTGLSGGIISGAASTIFGLLDIDKILALYVERGNLSANRSYSLNMYGNAGYTLAVYDGNSPTTATSVSVTIVYI